MQVLAQTQAQMRAAVAGVAADEAKPRQASPTRFAPGSPAVDSNRPTSPTKAPVALAAQRTLPRMKERRSRLSYPQAPLPAQLPIHFYCKERWAKDWRAMALEGLVLTDWYRVIPLERADAVDKARAEDAAVLADPEEVLAERAALVAPEAAQAAQCLAELRAAEAEVVAAECLAGAED